MGGRGGGRIPKERYAVRDRLGAWLGLVGMRTQDPSGTLPEVL